MVERKSKKRRTKSAAGEKWELPGEKNLHQELLDRLGTVVLRCEKSGKIDYLSQEWATQIGYPLEESIGKPLSDFVFPEDRNLLEAGIKRKPGKSDGKDFLKLRFLHRDGSTIWMEMSIYADEGGDFSGTLQNISDSKATREELELKTALDAVLANANKRFCLHAAEEGGLVIKDLLRQLGEFLGASHGFVYLTSEKQKSAASAFEWRQEGQKSLIERIRTVSGGEFPLLSRKLQDFEAICIEDIDELQEISPGGRDLLKQLDLSSIILVHFTQFEQFRGFLGFASSTGEHKFSEKIYPQLHIAGMLISSALYHKESRSILREADDILKRVGKPILVSDLEGRIIFASEAIEQVLGYKPAELVGKDWGNLFRTGRKGLSEERKHFAKVISESRKSHSRVLERERYIKLKNGQGRWFLWHDSAGLESNIVSIGYDITDTKKAEKESMQSLVHLRSRLKKKTEELTESEARNRTFFENNPMPMWVFDIESLDFLAVNNAATKQYGYSRDEFLTMTIKDIRPQEDLPQLQSDLESDLPELSEPREWRHKRKDGTIFPVTEIAHALDFDGREAGLVLAQDITQEKKAEEERNRLMSIIEHSNEFIGMTTLDGKLLYLNKVWQEKTGMDQLDTAGQPESIFEFIFEEDRKHFHEEIIPALLQKKALSTKLRIRHLITGEPIILLMKLFVIMDRQTGEPIALANVSYEIGDRELAEKALQESENKFRLLLQSTAEAIYGIDTDGNCTFANSACVTSLGYDSDQEFLGKNMHDLIHHSHEDGSPHPVEKCKIYQAFRDGRGTHVNDEVFWNKDGFAFPVEYWSHPIIKAGKVVGAVVNFLDISQRKQIKGERVRTVQELTRLIDTANAPIFGIDPSGKINEWNQTAARITGFSKDEVLGHDLVEEFITDDYRESVKEVLDDALRGEETANYEFPLYTKGGERVMVLLNATTRRNAAAEIVGVIGVGQNITELSEYRERLEELVQARTSELNKALLDTKQARDSIDGILKSVADGLIVTDIYNRVILMNRTAEDLLDVRFSEVIDKPIDLAIKEETLRERVKLTLEKRETGGQFDFEMPDQDSEGTRIMRARTSVITDKEDKQTGIVTIIHDVTHEREVDRIKTEFISTAAHELRTPLTSLQGFSELLLTRVDISEEERHRFLNHINVQAKGLAMIINDLLDISRIESGRGFVLKRESCPAGEAIRKVIIPFIEQDDIHSFEIEIPEDNVELIVDKEKMAQVLSNLISNAVKYSPDGGTIQIKGEVLDDSYHILVRDEGIGMTPTQVEKIFEKFYRGDSSNVAVESTGLGMSIARLIVEAHGGQISVESEYGQGTSVLVKIPL